MRGGRPPKESKIGGIRSVRVGVFAHDVAKELIVVVLFVLKERNREEVMIMYSERVRSVSDGENWRTRTIQPRWAIEEYARILRS